MELLAKQTLLAEGARGSLSQIAMEKFNLRQDCDAQTYGLGLKEVSAWSIASSIALPLSAPCICVGVAN